MNLKLKKTPKTFSSCWGIVVKWIQVVIVTKIFGNSYNTVGCKAMETYFKLLVIVLRWLKSIRRKIIYFDIYFQQGNTSLHLATTANHKDVVWVLVQSKCQVDIQNYVSIWNG